MGNIRHTFPLGVKLFEPADLGALRLSNRIVMAPLTRTRAGEHGVPNDLLVEHYAQRAGLGMIITEGTWPVQEGRSYPGQPGIETEEQIAGWRRVADAVHERGGTIVMQLMHGGRVSHPSISQTPRIVGPSAVAAPGQTHLADGSKADMPVPHEPHHRRGRRGRPGLRAGRPQRDRGRHRRRRGARRERVPRARVHVVPLEHPHRPVRRLAGEPRALRDRGHHGRRRGRRRGPHRHPPVARARHPGRHRGRRRRRPRRLLRGRRGPGAARPRVHRPPARRTSR